MIFFASQKNGIAYLGEGCPALLDQRSAMLALCVALSSIALRATEDSLLVESPHPDHFYSLAINGLSKKIHLRDFCLFAV